MAQRITGQVMDASTGAPASFAQVILSANTGDTIRMLADSQGMYGFRNLQPARYVLIAERIGYSRARTAPFDMVAGDTLVLNLRLTPDGIPLDPLVVVGKSGREPGRFAFARRCTIIESWCLNRDSLDLRQAGAVAHLFGGVEGIMVQWNPNNWRPHIKSFHCLKVFLNTSDFSISADRTRTWHFDALDPSDVLGIELYRDPKNVPREMLKGLRGAELFHCGVAVIWTKGAW